MQDSQVCRQGIAEVNHRVQDRWRGLLSTRTSVWLCPYSEKESSWRLPCLLVASTLLQGTEMGWYYSSVRRLPSDATSPDWTTPRLFHTLKCSDPGGHNLIPPSAHPTNLLPQPLKLRLASAQQVPYLPQVLDGFVPFELLSRIFLHLCPRWRRDLVACAEDSTVEGYGSLAEEEMVEGEGRLLGWGKSGGARAGCCVAAGEGEEEAHVYLRVMGPVGGYRGVGKAQFDAAQW